MCRFSLAFFVCLPCVVWAQNVVNFGEPLALKAIDASSISNDVILNPDYSFFSTQSDVLLATNNRVLVKVASNKTADTLFSLNGVESGELLAKFPTFCIYLLTLNHSNTIQFATDIAQRPDVIYAQPDMLQIDNFNRRWSLARRFTSNDSVVDQPKSVPSHVWQDWQSAINFVPGQLKANARIAIIDDGFNFSHPAFNHVTPVFQFDTHSRSRQILPRISGEKHGTMVAGLLFANWPDKNLQGLTPQASVIAIRNVYNWSSEIILAFYLAYLANADVINCSWGLPLLLEPIADSVNAIAHYGRETKGTAIVFAVGNREDVLNEPNRLETLEAVIAVAGVDKQYRVNTNHGATIDIAGPTLLPTTDARDYQKISYLGGSSSAAPVVAGIIALMISEAPNLTLYDIKSILKQSSQPLPNVSGFGFLNAQQAFIALNEKKNKYKK